VMPTLCRGVDQIPAGVRQTLENPGFCRNGKTELVGSLFNSLPSTTGDTGSPGTSTM
jgi:hypothetical protein